MTDRQKAAIALAADCIKETDGGDPSTKTGWASEELLDAWLTLLDMIEG